MESQFLKLHRLLVLCYENHIFITQMVAVILDFLLSPRQLFCLLSQFMKCYHGLLTSYFWTSACLRFWMLGQSSCYRSFNYYYVLTLNQHLLLISFSFFRSVGHDIFLLSVLVSLNLITLYLQTLPNGHIQYFSQVKI